jgi:orotate phosphoribosyltransferase
MAYNRRPSNKPSINKPKNTPKLTETKLGIELVNISYEDAKARLIEIIKAKSLFEGDSVLPSGRITSHYLDMKESILGAEGSFMASIAILHMLKDEVQFIGGLFDKTYSLAATTSQLALLRGQRIDTFFVRDSYDARRRGYSKWIEGPLRPATKVCLIQDEIVDGVKMIEAIRRVQDEADSEIVQVISVIDRLDGGAQRLHDYGVDYTSILTMNDIVTPVYY